MRGTGAQRRRNPVAAPMFAVVRGGVPPWPSEGKLNGEALLQGTASRGAPVPQAQGGEDSGTELVDIA